MDRIRILVVDDHPSIRKGLAATLNSEPDMEVVALAANRQDALALWCEKQPDITLMDLALENGTGGVEAICDIRLHSPTAKVIVFSALTGDEPVYQALLSGAVTFLAKDIEDEELVRTIRDVHAGGRPIPSAIAQKLADRLTAPSLSPREVEVVIHIAQGLRNKEIAGELHISEETVQSHVKHILSKLKVNDRTRAAIVAAKRGIIRI